MSRNGRHWRSAPEPAVSSYYCPSLYTAPVKPTRQQIISATDKLVDDIIADELRVLFCGINPGLYTAAVGHHFARPGNRFWPTLHAAGFTPRLFAPHEQRELIPLGYGITNVVARASAAADELSIEELRTGGEILVAKVLAYRPAVLAILGLGAYRTAFERPRASVGEQPERIGETRLWALPNPSGLNAHYQRDELARLFRELRASV